MISSIGKQSKIKKLVLFVKLLNSKVEKIILMHTCARTVTAKPHIALLGVLCSRPLRISNENVTVSPST